MDSKPKSKVITFDLICRCHLDDGYLKQEHDNIIDQVLKLTRIRLDGQGIEEIDNLECLGRVSHLYLHDNLIAKAENLYCLPHLKFLTLANNRLSALPDLTSVNYSLCLAKASCVLRCCSELKFLDVSDNNIETLDTSLLPSSLVFLNYAGNPCSSSTSSSALFEALPNLHQAGDVTRDGTSESADAEPKQDNGNESDDDTSSSTAPFRTVLGHGPLSEDMAASVCQQYRSQLAGVKNMILASAREREKQAEEQLARSHAPASAPTPTPGQAQAPASAVATPPDGRPASGSINGKAPLPDISSARTKRSVHAAHRPDSSTSSKASRRGSARVSSASGRPKSGVTSKRNPAAGVRLPSLPKQAAGEPR